MSSCQHSNVSLTPSSHAAEAGYHRPKYLQGATTANPYRSKRKRGAEVVDDDSPSPGSFPAPLVLPGDDLALEPDYPPQSFTEWLGEKDRNKVTPERNILYMVPAPIVAHDLGFMSSWRQRQVQKETVVVEDGTDICRPAIEDLVAYLSAFYHGITVKMLQEPKLCFTSWANNDSDKKAGKPSKSKTPSKAKSQKKPAGFIALTARTTSTRIRTRACPDALFPRQLNLDDLLDVAISILPADAYALLLLIEYDLFENADDVFTCGRAYGASRVAVISTARYDPGLDEVQGLEREHAWPASHCGQYVKACCKAAVGEDGETIRRQGRRKGSNNLKITRAPCIDPTSIVISTMLTSPMRAAIDAYTSTLYATLSQEPSTKSLSALYLSRICRTASHELGHCFGIDHCVYHACVMQGSASLAEDARQPMYLCPVDLAKVLHATGGEARERYEALLGFCGREDLKKEAVWAALGAWLEGRVSEIIFGREEGRREGKANEEGGDSFSKPTFG